MLTIPLNILILVLLLCIPYYFFSKWLERKIQPRQSMTRFISWFLIVLVSAVLYFWLAGSLYVRWLNPTYFSN